jgi:2-(1,2-epoxy-1,2-dihydrophenyl)acetyl-CoA isomerase
MSDEQPIVFEKIGAIGRITLNRPERLNAINSELATEFVAALEECGADDDVRAVLIRGAGRAFCAGDDIGGRSGTTSQRTARGPTDPSQSLKRPAYYRIVREIRGLPKPVVASVHGYALGAGCDVSLASDFRIVAEGTQFGLVFVKRGLIGGTWMIQQHLGLAKTTELLLMGEMFDATVAEGLGLVTKLVPQDSLDEEAEAYAAQVATGPTKTMGFIKAAINRGRHAEIDSGLESQSFAQTLATQTEDIAEGRLAFRERRDPNFTGR